MSHHHLLRSTRLLRCLIAIALLCASAIVQAADIRPFVSGSAASIAKSHQGQPYLLSLWSLNCPPCMAELAEFGRLAGKYPQFRWVLISTDSPAERKQIRATLKRYGLHQAENWVFADEFTERLRFELDRSWHGELPRNYFVDRSGERSAHSGKLDGIVLEAWIQKQLAH